MMNEATHDLVDDPMIVEREVVKSEASQGPFYRRMSWGAILAGVVVALLAQFAMEMLGVSIGAGAIEPGEDTLGPTFSSAVVVWLAVSMLLSLFAGGLVTGKLAGIIDPFDGALHGIVMMGLFAFITVFLLTSSITATLRGVTNTVSDGLSFVGASVQDVSSTVASTVELRDSTLDDIRAEAEEILAEDASLTSLRIALDDYLLDDESGDDTRQAAIEALATQTELTEQEAAARLDQWEADFRQTVNRFEAEAEEVASEIADIVAATAGVIFMLLVAGAFAAAAGGFVAVASQDFDYRTRETVVQRRAAAEVVS